MPEPALRAIFPPCPGWSSTLWTSVPVGMFSSGSALPGLMSASGPDSTVDPTRRRAGGVVQQGDPRRAVRVVLDRGDLRRNAVLHPLEVDHAVTALVPSALVPR